MTDKRERIREFIILGPQTPEAVAETNRLEKEIMRSLIATQEKYAGGVLGTARKSPQPEQRSAP